MRSLVNTGLFVQGAVAWTNNLMRELTDSGLLVSEMVEDAGAPPFSASSDISDAYAAVSTPASVGRYFAAQGILQLQGKSGANGPDPKEQTSSQTQSSIDQMTEALFVQCQNGFDNQKLMWLLIIIENIDKEDVRGALEDFVGSIDSTKLGKYFQDGAWTEKGLDRIIAFFEREPSELNTLLDSMILALYKLSVIENPKGIYASSELRKITTEMSAEYVRSELRDRFGDLPQRQLEMYFKDGEWTEKGILAIISCAGEFLKPEKHALLAESILKERVFPTDPSKTIKAMFVIRPEDGSVVVRRDVWDALGNVLFADDGNVKDAAMKTLEEAGLVGEIDPPKLKGRTLPRHWRAIGFVSDGITKGFAQHQRENPWRDDMTPKEKEKMKFELSAAMGIAFVWDPRIGEEGRALDKLDPDCRALGNAVDKILEFSPAEWKLYFTEGHWTEEGIQFVLAELRAAVEQSVPKDKRPEAN